MAEQTLYQHATELMVEIISQMLSLSQETAHFTNPNKNTFSCEINTKLFFAGVGLHTDFLPPTEKRHEHWLSRSAVPFNIEQAATTLLYERIKPFVDLMIDKAYEETQDFQSISDEWLYENPHLLPIVMHASGTFSKQELKKLVGSVSDTGISKPASKRLADFLETLPADAVPSRERIRERMKATTEGIVRDLVGRLLLEEFVASSLREAQIPFKRESEYDSLSGVVYDFRADFVVPDENTPKAFLEVRKSSSRHASLYAKDKMFSAINWKGKHKDCLGIVVVDGPWTNSSLEVMSRVFDYVIPIAQAPQMASIIARYINGDKSVLRWLIHFKIDACS